MKKTFLTLLTLLLLGGASYVWGDAITVTWLPDGSSSSVTSVAGTASVANILTVANLTKSSDIKSGPTAKDYSTGGTHWYGYFTPTTALGEKEKYSKDDYITFAVTVKDGYIFTPTSATLEAIGIGTGNVGAGIFATVQTSNGSGTIGKGDSSNQNNTTLTLNSFSAASYAAGETLYFYVHIGVKDADKSVGLRDVVLTGTYEVASTDPVPASITTQPSNTETSVGTETTLSVEAAGYPVPDYQWYECDDAEKTNAAAIDGATSDSYSFTPDATGTRYFYVTVNNENNDSPVASNVVTVTVSAGTTADPTFKVYGNTVQLACATDGAVIYYELDNEDVKTSGSKVTYSGAFIPAASGTIYAYAQKDGYAASAVVSKAVTLSTVGNVVGDLIATVQAAKDAKTTVFDNITVTSPASPTWDGRGAYPNHMKVSGTVTLSASANTMIKSIKIYSTSNDGSKAATVTAGDGATVISTPAELMPRDVTVGGVQTMTEIVLTIDEPARANSVSFTLGRESRLYVEVYGTEYVAASLGEYKWATFVSNKALDFTDSDVKAYVITGHEGSVVTMNNDVKKVPANTPLLLNAAQDTYYVPVTADPETITTNLLHKGTGEAIGYEANKTRYVLGVSGSGAAEFQKLVDGGSSATVPTNKAYLEFDEVIAAPSLHFEFDEENNATNVETIEANEKAVKFIQNGQLLILRDGITYDALGRVVR